MSITRQDLARLYLRSHEVWAIKLSNRLSIETLCRLRLHNYIAFAVTQIPNIALGSPGKSTGLYVGLPPIVWAILGASNRSLVRPCE